MSLERYPNADQVFEACRPRLTGQLAAASWRSRRQIASCVRFRGCGIAPCTRDSIARRCPRRPRRVVFDIAVVGGRGNTPSVIASRAVAATGTERCQAQHQNDGPPESLMNASWLQKSPHHGMSVLLGLVQHQPAIRAASRAKIAPHVAGDGIGNIRDMPIGIQGVNSGRMRAGSR